MAEGKIVMSQNCLAKIRSYYPRLSDKEKRIADYILEYPSDFIHQTISQVAENLRIAEATVFRFCKRVGFKGYQDMKIALASETMSLVEELHEQVTETDDEKTIVQKVFQANIKTLEHTIELLQEPSLKKAIDYLVDANHIHFYGVGGSAITALDAYHKFVYSGLKAFSFMDAHFQEISAAQLRASDVAVIISHTGTNPDMLNIFQTAKNNGAKTIGITSFPKSPLSQKCDVALFTTAVETKYRSEALASRIAQQSLIDALLVNIMQIKDVRRV